MTETGTNPQTYPHRWLALWSLLIGFFMILIDATIVTVAMPDIIVGLDTDITGAVWVTSAYLLAFAVPLLITGRLGDRFGQKSIFLIGIVVFTLASLWCGLAGSIQTLIIARAIQGLGGALISPQTLSVITRIFRPQERGQATAIWGAVAGVGAAAGPLLGGLLLDSLGWGWIFFINVPIGIIGMVMTLKFVPHLPILSSRSFDWVGVIFSALAIGAIIFGIQEGDNLDWGGTVWAIIGAGVVLLVVFVWWESRTKVDPLVPLSLFKDRNFSAANLGIFAMGFAMTSMFLPWMLYMQTGRGLSPLQAALIMVPQALMGLVGSPLVGRYMGTIAPRTFTVIGFVLMAVGLFGITLLMGPDFAVWQVIWPSLVLGAGSSMIWGPLSLAATANLPMNFAGAGSGVYNTTRQIGSVLGSAVIAAVMAAEIAGQLGGGGGSAGGPAGAGGGSTEAVGQGPLPEPLRAGFEVAMAHSMAWVTIALALGAVSCAFLVLPKHMRREVVNEPSTRR